MELFCQAINDTIQNVEGKTTDDVRPVKKILNSTGKQGQSDLCDVRCGWTYV